MFAKKKGILAYTKKTSQKPSSKKIWNDIVDS